MNILFLCKGNVGRSQIAEALCSHYCPEFNVFSAGTNLSGPEQSLESLLPGTEFVISVMNEEGIDISKNTRKQMNSTILDKTRADKVILITKDPLPTELISDERVVRWEIEDPKGMSLEDTRKIRDLIKEKVLELGTSL